MTASPERRPRVLFLGSTYAGYATRFANLRRHVESDGRVVPQFRAITGWHPDGTIERLPMVPPALKGRVRATLEAARVAAFPRPDLIWTSCRAELAPYFPVQMGPLRRPLLLDLDATDAQLEQMSQWYFGRPPKHGLRALQSRAAASLVYRQASCFTPWSKWAADGLRKQGVEDSRMHVLPPGVDLSFWRPVRRDSGERPLRVLFVGGDFIRKGGDLLLAAVSESHAVFELAIVTRDETGDLPPGARVVRADRNSPGLKAIHQWADVFVLPTRAECFGIATVEAMASGLPVIVGDVGGARDIVVDGVTGWLIEPDLPALRHALGTAAADRTRLLAMGERGRRRAERRFDADRNARELVDLMLALADTPGAAAQPHGHTECSTSTTCRHRD